MPPSIPTCAAGVIFFNNVGYLGMCGHGTIGVAVALAHLGRIGPGTHRLETPVGVVTITLEGPNTVTIDNVESYRLAKDVSVAVPGLKTYVGRRRLGRQLVLPGAGPWRDAGRGQRRTADRRDLADSPGPCMRKGSPAPAARRSTISSSSGRPALPEADSKNFVLCPGKAYDRSPCGTGTSAKLACLVADGKLKEGEIWRQESIIGSVFEGSVRIVDGRVRPRIRGTAYVNAESTLIIDPADPFALGIRP